MPIKKESQLPPRLAAVEAEMKAAPWHGAAWLSCRARQRGFGDVLVLSEDGLGVLAFRVLKTRYKWISVREAIGCHDVYELETNVEQAFAKLTGKTFNDYFSQSALIRNIRTYVNGERVKLAMAPRATLHRKS